MRAMLQSMIAWQKHLEVLLFLRLVGIGELSTFGVAVF